MFEPVDIFQSIQGRLDSMEDETQKGGHVLLTIIL